MDYTIKLTKNQLHIILEALDLYSRIGIGQIEEVDNLLKWKNKDHDCEAVELLSEYKKKVTGFDLNASYGICNDKVRTEFKDAFDMIKTIQLKFAQEGDSHKYSVWWDGNFLKLGKEPIMEITS